MRDCLGTTLEVGQVITWRPNYDWRGNNVGYIKEITEQGSILAVVFEAHWWHVTGEDGRWRREIRGYDRRVTVVRTRHDRITAVPGLTKFDLEQRFPAVEEEAA